jgi:D-sedoheptulose 7-phosphate isomerase
MSDDKKFLSDSLDDMRKLLDPALIADKLVRVKQLFVATKQDGRKVMLFGNGGSATIAAHVAIDLTKNAHIQAMQCNEYGWITCLANDYGYERWMEKSVELYGQAKDVAVFISSSGKSPNVLRGAEKARAMGMTVITFSGFDANNPLSRLGELNLHVESHAYNHVEMIHQMWLLAVVDAIIGKTVYSASAE